MQFVKGGGRTLLIIGVIAVITGLETGTALLPLHRYVGQPKDSGAMAAWRVLAWSVVYAPAACAQTPRPLATAVVVVVAAVLGVNPYPFIGVDRAPWLDVLWVVALLLWLVLLVEATWPYAHRRKQWWSQVLWASGWIVAWVASECISTFGVDGSGYGSGYGSFAIVSFVFACIVHLQLGERLRWRSVWDILQLWVLLPAIVVVVAIVLQYVHARAGVRNFSGFLMCGATPATRTPTSEQELRDIVRLHANVRVAGAFHSWSPLMCPKANGVLVVLTELRAMQRVDNELLCGPGVTMGSLSNRLLQMGRQLPTGWHPDVTIGGAVATGTHHRGQAFVECCVARVRLMLANGTDIWVDRSTVWAGVRVWPHLPGSAGILGLLIEIHVLSQPLAPVRSTVTRTEWNDDLEDHLANWTRGPHSSVLFIVPSQRTLVHSDLNLSTPSPAPPISDYAALTIPIYSRPAYFDPGLAFEWYTSAWSVLYATAAGALFPMGFYGLYQLAFIEDNLVTPFAASPVEGGDSKRIGLNRLGTQFASLEVDVPVSCTTMPRCVAEIAAM